MKKNRLLRHLFFTLVTGFLLVNNADAQESLLNDPGKTDYLSNTYRLISVGLILPNYTDFSTSPLSYSGWGPQAGIAYLKRSAHRERLFEISGSYSPGLTAAIPLSDFIQPATGSNLARFNFRYSRLWRIKKLSNALNNIKIGGMLQSTQHLRINPSLGNTSTGLENISNLMFSGQIIRDVSRKSSRRINLLVAKPLLKPVKRDLRFQFNAGILNFNRRPGYAYIYSNEINGLQTDLTSFVGKAYSWTLNGWRFNTELEYISYLPNGNARSLSYVWDVLRAPGKFESFQMASHQIRFTYYFNVKKNKS
jgi:hypothetical protein